VRALDHVETDAVDIVTVSVPLQRVERWAANFVTRHGPTAYDVRDGALHGTADDGSTFTARLPLGASYDGPADPGSLMAAASLPDSWGILLVRKGGFAVARMAGFAMAEHKIGQRHVQGRTKAGGQSQQRFARRRDNQKRQAFEAAADHAARLLRPGLVVTGGDHAAVDDVLADPRLRGLVVVEPWLAVPDPKRSVLDRAVSAAASVQVGVVNA
jgi:hypothetical protein